MSNLIKIRYVGIGDAEKEHGTIANHKKGNAIPEGWVVVESEGWDGVSTDEDLSCDGKYMVFHYNIVLDRLKKKDAPIIHARPKTQFTSNPVVIYAPEQKNINLTQTKAGFFV